MHGLKVAFTGLPRQYNNLREEILDATDIVLRSGNLMDGNNTAEFEAWLAKKNHNLHAVTCHSGTQALEIIAAYCFDNIRDVGKTPTVLIPAMTYPATANAFIMTGWQVEIADTDKYGCMDSALIRDDHTRSYDAICVVGLYGAALNALTRRFSMTDCLIEDGAQHWLSDNCHRQAQFTAISFDPTKNLPNYGNGGAVVTSDLYLAEYARNWCNNGKAGGHAIAGTNSRMSEIDCAQMMIKTQHLDAWQLRRSQIARYWMARLEEKSIRCLIDDTNFEGHALQKFVIEVDNQSELQQRLAAGQIETKVHYKSPLHELTAYQDCKGPNLLSVASSLARRCVSLPFYPELTDLETDYIIDSVLAAV
jgi:dTDP-4-amino-4,6-dideoxygalactose transaminase